MAGGISLRIPATLESLALVQDFVGTQSRALGLGRKSRPDSNWWWRSWWSTSAATPIHHAGRGRHGGGLRSGSQPQVPSFCLILRDWGEAFNPLSKEAPDLEAGLDERQPGGLGIFLVRELADHCSYRRHGDANGNSGPALPCLGKCPMKPHRSITLRLNAEPAWISHGPGHGRTERPRFRPRPGQGPAPDHGRGRDSWPISRN